MAIPLEMEVPAPLAMAAAEAGKPRMVVARTEAMRMAATEATVARTLVGIGEASFCSIAPVFIDDYAPERQRGLWLAIYYTFLPLGFAVGYGYGRQEINDS